MTDAALQDAAIEAASAAVLDALDEDLAATIRHLPVMRRTTEGELLAVQRIRLERRLIGLLEKLCDSDSSGTGGGNG